MPLPLELSELFGVNSLTGQLDPLLSVSKLSGDRHGFSQIFS